MWLTPGFDRGDSSGAGWRIESEGKVLGPMPVELHAASAFSFLRGSSLPEQLVQRAAELGYDALALLDRDGVAGAPRFFRAAKKAGIRPLVGAELTLKDG